jgi:hypothetical protein
LYDAQVSIGKSGERLRLMEFISPRQH